ncbi:MAG: spore germination protein GerW family protein [Myxococcales bacterium]
MELKILLDDLMRELVKVAQTGALVGKPLTLGDTHMVPLCKISLGFGSTTSDAQGKYVGREGALDGAAAGGALSVEPRAFVVVGPDGVPQMLSMRRGKRVVLQHAVEVRGNTEHPQTHALAVLPERTDLP